MPPLAFSSSMASSIPLRVEIPKVACAPVREPTSPMRMVVSDALETGFVPGGAAPDELGSPVPPGFCSHANNARQAKNKDRTRIAFAFTEPLLSGQERPEVGPVSEPAAVSLRSLPVRPADRVWRG